MDASKPAEPVAKKKEDGPEKWEIESWVRTIMEADEIKHDPEKWAAVRPHLEKKAKAAVKTMAELRDRQKEAEGEEDESVA
jgi:hypothetical protein